MPSLLVIDDEELVAQTFAAIAEEEGFTVEIALSEKEAREKLKSAQFDAVLTDNALTPDGNEGLKLLQDIRSTPEYQQNRHSVLTFVSARPPEDEIFNVARRNGAEIVSNKPPKDFWALLENIHSLVKEGARRPKPGLVHLQDVNVTVRNPYTGVNR